MTAEPLLIEQIEEFRDELNTAIQGEVDKLIEENFTHIDRVSKFITNRSAIGTILNDEYLNKIMEDFENKA